MRTRTRNATASPAALSLANLGQPDIPWQNRSTFQQVVSFPAHRPR